MATVFDGVPQLSHMDVGPALSQYVRGNQLAMQEEEMKTARDERVGKIVAQGAISADSPEKWSSFIGVLQKRFPNADLGAFTDFNSRQPMLDTLRNYAQEKSDARADARQDKALSVSSANAERTHKLEREKFDYLKDKPTEVSPGSALVKDGKEVYRAPSRPTSLTATDKKAIFEAEDSNVGLKGTVETLKAAKALNDKTFTGATAKARGWIGSSIPGAGYVMDTDAANATREWDQIMSMEAIKSMSANLKGATTDRELFEFQRILSDPSTPPDIRGRTIDRMVKLAERQMEVNAARANELKAGTYYDTNKPAAASPPAGGGAPPQAGAGGAPPVPGARQAPDGNWYVKGPNGYLRWEP